MTREELKEKLQSIEAEIHNLTTDSGVMWDTALYAYLNTASYTISQASICTREYNEERAETLKDLK